ncbi:hypothetical protein QTP88_015719 [Uroleucon formosanum]
MAPPAKPTSPAEISGIIKNLANRKSPGHDLLTNKIIKNLPAKTIIFLAHIYNATLRLSYFPTTWKSSVIVTILKSGKPPEHPSSYRPISLLPVLEATYNRTNVENSSENRAFKTSAREIFVDSDLSLILEDCFNKLKCEEEEYTSKGSGFSFQYIDGILLGIYKYCPLSGASYIQLPPCVDHKRATINPQNADQLCFKWAILAKHVEGENKYRINNNYTKHEDKYSFEGISFPTPLSDIKKFEKNNQNVSINVYGVHKQYLPPPKLPTYKIFPLKVVDEEKRDHFDLLLVTENDKSHYIFIYDFSRLIRSQKTKHNGRVIFCKRCFTTFDDRKFEGWSETQRHPFVIYADFEALLVKCDERKGESTTAFQKHMPVSYGVYVKAADNIPIELLDKFNIPTSIIIYRGSETRTEVAKHFVETVVEISRKLEILLKTNIDIIISNEEQEKHDKTTTCNLCKKDFTFFNDKVRDHCHLSGQFRQSICNKCNLALKMPKFVPCLLHNLSNYDTHFIAAELGYDQKNDTCRLMASKLSTLATNLITPDLEKFRETAKHFSNEDLKLVTRKGIYPYEFTEVWSKLEETALPPKEYFYSTLTEEHIKDEEYQHAIEVWYHFNCQTLGEYSDLYLKIDVLLLADVFENFRDICLKTYSLDADFYYTAPGLSFDACLKYTSIKLELLADYDMLLMCEKGIRGGITQASLRYAKANNYKTPDYDSSNNLYGWAMSEYMPYGDFKWVKPTLNGLEFDIEYPKHLHNDHNDLPFLPNKSIPAGLKYQNSRQHSNLKNIISYTIVHRVLQFRQSPWLAKYINLNTEMRKKARNDFEKDFYKLMNNSVFGKTTESMRSRLKMELVTSEKRLQKLINRTTFKYCTDFENKSLTAVTMENKIIDFYKPIYIGFAVLKISKTLMFDYHYNVMKKFYGSRLSLMYTDTGSLIYYILTRDFYSDLKNNPILLDRLDTSELPNHHPCYMTVKKKVPGFFSDETEGRTMIECVALRAKSYAFNIEGGEKIKAKGIRPHVVKHHMTLEDHKKCLFGEDGIELYRENVSIRSFNYQLRTISTKKLTYNSYDDKRVVLDDKIHTLAHGHYSLEDDDKQIVEWPDQRMHV